MDPNSDVRLDKTDETEREPESAETTVLITYRDSNKDSIPYDPFITSDLDIN